MIDGGNHLQCIVCNYIESLEKFAISNLNFFINDVDSIIIKIVQLCT